MNYPTAERMKVEMRMEGSEEVPAKTVLHCANENAENAGKITHSTLYTYIRYVVSISLSKGLMRGKNTLEQQRKNSNSKQYGSQLPAMRKNLPFTFCSVRYTHVTVYHQAYL